MIASTLPVLPSIRKSVRPESPLKTIDVEIFTAILFIGVTIADASRRYPSGVSIC